ncbi:Rrf2 family transcriptional regulator [Iodidimonas sp. SYSU 1G8]|uniref:RrF2 family transcriptional regulator n=1 Tax=Iodidimonas sp. SYSU 1G8 TaxID=3133967 RepID=UPI0031FEF5B2
MLSQKAKYALKALLVLAERAPGVPVQVADLSEQGNIPRKFLELIMLELKKHGIVHSQRGKHGGYMLASPPAEISFGAVVRAMDGPLAPIPCASLTGYRKCADCRNEKTCAVRIMMRRVRDAAAEILDGTSLADMSIEDLDNLENQSLSA